MLERMQDDTSKYLDLWYEITNYLNKKIQTTGEIQINQVDIWQKYLHKLSDKDWENLCEMVYKVLQQDESMLEKFHKDALVDAMQKLDDAQLHGIKEQLNNLGASKRHINNVLDIPSTGKKIQSTKGTAWKMLMSLREIWNNVCDINLPNKDSSKGKGI